MPQTQTARLEFGERPIIRTRGIVLGGVAQKWRLRENGEHLPGIVFPVRRQMQVAARLQPITQQMDKAGLDQAPFVMAFFVPRVGKKNVDTCQTGGSDTVSQYLNGIVLDNPQIIQMSFTDLFKQGSNTGRVYLNAEKIMVRLLLGDVGSGLSHTKTDLDNARRFTAKHGIQSKRLALPRQDEVGAEFSQGAFLATAHTASAQDEALDGAMFGIGGFVQDPIMPVVGEEGLA